MAMTPTRKTQVLVVHERRTIGEAVAAVITMQPDMSGRAVPTGSEAERALSDDLPDVVLLGTVAADDEPGSVARLLARAPDLRVLIVADDDDEQLRADARRAGAYGFLTTFEPVDRIVEAIRTAMTLERPGAHVEEGSGATASRQRRRQPHATERQRSDRLSPREREILQLMADGSEPPEIVAQLGITQATLRTHVQNILTKLRVHSKTQAVLMAIRHGKVTGRR